MTLVPAVIALALVVGLLLGGRPQNLLRLRLRWPLLAIAGLALQFLPAPGGWPSMALLYASFAVLAAFVLVNIRTPGLALVLLGIALNFAVIAANGGMPVTRAAIVASHQQGTISSLVRDGGAKHHLATGRDALLPLADVIPIAPAHQIVSAGDLATYTGICWLLAAGMRRRRTGPQPVTAEGRGSTTEESLRV